MKSMLNSTITMRVTLAVCVSLLLCDVSTQNGSITTGEVVTSPVEGFLETIHNVLPALKDILSSVFREVNKTAFRSALAAAVDLVEKVYPAQPPPHVPEKWWGEVVHNETSVRPYIVQFTCQMISDLRTRIHQRRYVTPALNGAANTYGTHAGYLAQFLDHWANAYDFGTREDWLNSFPQYVTNIQGLDIHFIHVKPLNPHKKKILPLLLLHGFPVTAFEYVHVIQLLLEERDCDFVFEMIVPNLPGYGFSEATNKIGMAFYEMGIIMKNLMLRLGKPRFYIHAGDVGHVVGDAIAVLFPDVVLGFHTNLASSLRPKTLAKWVLGQLYPPAVVGARYQDRMYPLSARFQAYMEHFGYFHMQATKPDNVGHGLDESPVALLSWNLATLMIGTGPSGQRTVNGNLSANYDMNDWLDTFTIYWASRSMTSAVRSYAEFIAVHQNPLSFGILMTPTPVPFAAIKFRYEIIYHPDDFLRDKYPNLVHSTTLNYGGHFVAFQEPADLADSIRSSVEKMELFHINQQKSG